MDNASYIMIGRLASQQRMQALSATNIANADTPGFRATRPVFAEHLHRQSQVAAAPGGRPVHFSWDRATWRDTSQGALQSTGNPLDVALAGDGFFAVETPRGERYTRSGRFSLGADGRIVDAQGNAVLGTGGRPLALSPADTRIEILGDGTIRSENGVLGRIRVVRFADEQALRAEGDRLFDAPGQAPQEIGRPGVVQGSIEGSNVQPVIEMTRMMADLREFQMATQFLEREGERQQSAVERLLRRRS